MKKISLIIPLISLLLFSGASNAQESASFTLSPPSGTYETGDTMQMNIYVDTEGQNIDTARASMTYSAEMLEVESFTYGPAFIIPSPESGFDNQAGTLSYGAGIPGGTTEGTVFGTVTFRVKEVGVAIVELNGSSMILCEGESVYSGRAVQANFELTTPVPTQTPMPTQTPVVTETVSPTPESPSPSAMPSESPIANVETETGANGFLADIMAGLWGKIIFLAIIIFLGTLGGLFWLSKSK